MFRKLVLLVIPLAALGCVAPTTPESSPTGVDGKGDLFRSDSDNLRHIASLHGAVSITEVLEADQPQLGEPLVELGRSLFFDKILSGNRDISCATCHHPEMASGDGLPLPVGVGGTGLGPDRQRGADEAFIPRNAPEIFNRGATAWNTMFWDMRVTEQGGSFYTPAQDAFPQGLDSVLAAQAMFPPTSAHEMRGEPGQNEVADAADERGVWSSLAARLRATPGYRAPFEAAFAGRRLESLRMVDVANAIAAFEVAAFTFEDAPFDRFMRGDDDALTAAQQRGAALFFGEARCVSCHSGPLLTDQRAHAIAVPQLGPGKGDAAPEDLGRFAHTGEEEDRYAFRTPPLRNVSLTGPYMHDGAFESLEDAVRHHLDPLDSLLSYDLEQLPPELRETVLREDSDFDALLMYLDEELLETPDLSDSDVQDLVAFLEALTDPAAARMGQLVPTDVPSGLPVAD